MAVNRSILWLVAEDNDDDFILLQRACSRIAPAPKLHRAKNGIEAQCYLAGMGAFAKRSLYPLPALILSDLKMPRMDGFELLAWVKSQVVLGRIPFVFLTCSMLERDRDRANELGANGYLVKPTNSVAFGCILQAVSDTCRTAPNRQYPSPKRLEWPRE